MRAGVAVAPDAPFDGKPASILLMRVLVVAVKAWIQVAVGPCSSCRRKPGSILMLLFARHPREGGDPWTFHAFPDAAQQRRPALARHCDESQMPFALALGSSSPRRRGSRDFSRFPLSHVRDNKAKASVRLKPAGSLFFADPKSDWIPFGQT